MAELFPEYRDHTGFGSIGDEFDGVDKVLARGEQAAEAIGLGQIFDGDVVGRLLPQRFELFVFTSKGFDGLPQLPIFPLVIGYLFIGQSGEFQSTEQRPLPALFFA